MATYFPQPQAQVETQNPLRLAQNYQKNIFRQQDQQRQSKIDKVNTMRYALSTGNKSQAEAIWKSMYPDTPMPETEFQGGKVTQVIEKGGRKIKITGPQESIVAVMKDRADRPDFYEDPRNQPLIQQMMARGGISFEDVTGKASDLDKRMAFYDNKIKTARTANEKRFYEKKLEEVVSGRPRTEVNVQTGPKPLVKAMSTALVASQKDAEGAVQGLITNRKAQKMLEEGMVTGTGANFLVGLGNFVSSRLGFNEFDDPVANAQAYAAMKGRETGQIIKQFGSGTGLSDQDRIYAKKIVAGEITLTKKALEKLNKINDRWYRYTIEKHNKKARKAMDRYGAENLPYSLVVEIPKETNDNNSNASKGDISNIPAGAVRKQVNSQGQVRYLDKDGNVL